MNRFLLLLGICALAITSCNSGAPTEELLVASEQADCVGVAPMKCLLVKTKGQTDWQFFYNDIEGFTYEPGYEYTLVVRKEAVASPAADQSSVRYILVRQESKVQKVSDNLPQASPK